MKTPEEIKKDAETCLTLPPKAVCNRLELYKDCGGDCRYVIKELYDLVLHYESRLAQVVRERDAMKHDLLRDPCEVCKHDETYLNDCHTLDRCNWEWRGVCEANTEE